MSSQIKDIILNSSLITGGRTTSYQLKLKKECLDGATEAESKIRRWTYGEKDPTKPNKTVLLVGETGTGKSTLINAMVNHVMGVKWEDEVWFEIVAESRRRQSESQTSEVTVYEIFGFEGRAVPFSVTVIDSPGFGDTKGTDTDTQVAEKLLSLFRYEGGIHDIDAVGFVIKATENRLSDRQQYIFDAVISLFGNDLEKNVVALITHSDGGSPTNALQALEDAKVKCAKSDTNRPIYFLFNNRQNDDITNKKEERVVRFGWDTSVDGLEEFWGFLGQVKPRKLNVTVNVLNNRDQLNACITNLQEKIRLIGVKQAEITSTKDAIENEKQWTERCKDFTHNVQESYRERVSTPNDWWRKMATTCNVCKENCHYPGCTMTLSPLHCWYMSNGHCLVCSGRCHHSIHVRTNSIFETRYRTVTRTIEDLTDKYVKHSQNVIEKQAILMGLERDLEDLAREKTKWVQDCYQCVIRLEEMALNKDSLFTHIHLETLIKQLRELGEADKVQRLEEMKRRAGDRPGQENSYMLSKLGTLTKT